MMETSGVASGSVQMIPTEPTDQNKQDGYQHFDRVLAYLRFDAAGQRTSGVDGDVLL